MCFIYIDSWSFQSFQNYTDGLLYLYNMMSFIQMFVIFNIPKVQAPFGVSLLHPVLVIRIT